MLAGGLLRYRTIGKFERRRRRQVLAAEAVLVLAALWLVGRQVAAVRLSGPVQAALLLVLVSWVFTCAIKLAIFVAVSWDDFRDLLLASLSASAPAMWLAPAILFLSTPSQSARAMGLLLVANTVRLLVSRNAPQKLAPATAPVQSGRDRLFRYRAESPFWREAFPPILGALALQTGVCGMWTERPLYAALLVASGTALWTWLSIARGVLRRDDNLPSHWLLSIAVTLLLTTSLSFVAARISWATIDDAGDAGLLETGSRLWQQLLHPPPASAKAPKPAVARAVNPPRNALKIGRPSGETGAGNLVPGVILRPQAKPRRILLIPLPAAIRLHSPTANFSSPLTFPFTGEYQLFPTSSTNLKHDWAVEPGSLLEHAYATVGGGSLETEAYQGLDPPFDFANCGRIGLRLKHEEDAPFAATMQLVTASGVMDLGSQICGLDRQSEETLEFDLPPGPASLPVKAIRMAFHRIPKQGTLNMRVEVLRFTLAPRAR